MAARGHNSHHHSEYCTSYNESLRTLKDSILQDGRLSGTELQRCLLINGVPVHDCPTPDQLLQRLGLSHLPQNDTPSTKTSTLGRFKKRNSFRMKGRKARNLTDSHDTTEFLIMQLLHSCLQLMSLEATKQTPVHAPLSPNTGEEKEVLLREDKKDTNEKSKDNDRDINTQSILYDNIDLEFCYIKRERKLGVDKTSELLKDDAPLVTDGTNRELLLLRHENQILQRNLNRSESYTNLLETKCDDLCDKLSNSQSQISKLTNKQFDSESIPGMG